MAQTLSLPIERREHAGTSASRSLRHAGKVPAVLYGHGTAPQSISFERKTFEDLLHHGARTSLITLTLAGRRFETALLRDLQIDPVSRKVVHVDLQRVSADETVRAKLPVVTTGTPAGVRDFGGVMDVVAHEVEIEGPANKLPDRIEVDVSALGIHEHVSAGEVSVPEGFKMVTAPDVLIVTVEPSRTERALEEAATGPTEQGEPELVGGGEAEGSSQ